MNIYDSDLKICQIQYCNLFCLILQYYTIVLIHKYLIVDYIAEIYYLFFKQIKLLFIQIIYKILEIYLYYFLLLD